MVGQARRSLRTTTGIQQRRLANNFLGPIAHMLGVDFRASNPITKKSAASLARPWSELAAYRFCQYGISRHPRCSRARAVHPMGNVSLYKIAAVALANGELYATGDRCRGDRRGRRSWGTTELNVRPGRFLFKRRAFHIEIAIPQSEYTMNIFYIIGVVVVIIFVAGFFGIHA